METTLFKKITLRRVIQTFSLLVFLSLLTAVCIPAAHVIISKIFGIFLMADPLSALTVSLASRSIAEWVFVPVAVVVLTMLFGRIFCGYICPLGTTIDIFDSINGTKVNESYPKLSGLRFILLFAVVAAAALGVNLAFHFLPISLATRFYGLLIYPAVSFTVSETAGIGQNLFGWFDYFSIESKRYAAVLFTASIFLAMFLISRRSKRFWCRYICPTGALLGLLSVFSINKRRVSQSCISCNKCEKDCPTNAINKIFDYDSQTCISCKKCVEVCPADAAKFAINTENPAIQHGQRVTRREIVGGLALGGGAAFVSMSELDSLININTEHGAVVYEGLIRPPGAVPEKEFLSKCIRCGECMAACPTNGLQPLTLQSGSAALLSPVLVPLRGKCEAKCNICGKVCPTGAIQELPLEEKQHAKIGTARIRKERCLAWAENKACMVCDEVCPYNAMKLEPEEGFSVTVPRVDVNRCFGCGACEYSCPLEVPALIVEPVKELRQNTPDYIERSKALGLELTVSETQEVTGPDDSNGLPPGFEE